MPFERPDCRESTPGDRPPADSCPPPPTSHRITWCSRGLHPFSGHDAYTFIEVMVAILVGSILLGISWSFLSSSSRQGRQADIRLQGLHGGLVFTQRFEHDFKRLCYDDGHDIVLNPEGKTGISFFIYKPSGSDLSTERRTVVRIKYLFDASRFAIYRVEGTSRPRRLKGYYEALVFTRHGFHDYSRPPSSPPLPGGMITYLVTAAPKNVLESPPSRRKAADRTTFWCSVAIRSANLSLAEPHWPPGRLSVPVDD